ncbi:16910_t:CDS:1 [Funneliformis geosporum]|uniref:16910_t:CDS:1 n=1 Tax=Funneliformis geosporum TaxID=1117311 RepID=A0A9W4SPP3_9GLOM|nr:16910_t:CDS:1 [Funneliformis geosporum]
MKKNVLEVLQDIIFPQLLILKFDRSSPYEKKLIKFLENNGKNLKELFLSEKIDSINDYSLLNITIATFCPNLKSLRTSLSSESNVNLLTLILKHCKQLEFIEIMCYDSYGSWEHKVMEIIVEFSPKKFYELNSVLGVDDKLDTLFIKELKSIFESWSNRMPCILRILRKLTMVTYSEFENGLRERNVEIIKELENIGVIKKLIKI